MKGKILKKAIRTILIMTIIFSLIACGKGAAETGNESKGNSEMLVEVNRENFVYIPEKIELPNEIISAACGTEQGIYFTSPFADDATFTAGVKVYFADSEGKCKELPIKCENTESASVSIDSIGTLGDGSLVFIKNEMSFDIRTGMTGESRYYLVHANPESGEELSCVDITEQLQIVGEYSVALELEVDKNDHIYISDGSRIWVFDVEGNQPFNVIIANGSWVNGMGVTREGQVVFYGWEEQQCICIIDENSGMLTSVKDNIPNKSLFWGGIIPGDVKGIWVGTATDYVEYDIESGKATPVFSMADSGLNVDNIRGCTVLDNGNVLILFCDMLGEESESGVILLKKTDASTVTDEKEVITMGLFEENAELAMAVADFNKRQDGYKIEIINYIGNSDLDTAITRFSNELISGNAPDIIDLYPLNVNSLASKDALEELTPYLENDAKVKREELFESVLDAYLIDGGLYTIPNSFGVYGVVGGSEYLSDCENGYSWTVEDVEKLINSNPDMEIFGYNSKSYILTELVRNNLGKFVNWQSGECDFEGTEFLSALKLANCFNDKFEGVSGEYNPYDIVAEGETMAEITLINSTLELQFWKALLGDDFVIKGFPTEEGSGIRIVGENLLGINASSNNKEKAWEFISSLLTKEYYENMEVEGFPTLISAYDALNEQHSTPEYITDESGNPSEISKGDMGMGEIFVQYYAASQEDVARMTDIINNCDRIDANDDKLLSIIMEESEAYFAGHKTAEDVAGIIQSRATLYVNENR